MHACLFSFSFFSWIKKWIINKLASLSIYPIGDGINDAREILLSRPFLVFEMEITVNSVTLERFYRFVCIYIYIRSMCSFFKLYIE